MDDQPLIHPYSWEDLYDYMRKNDPDTLAALASFQKVFGEDVVWPAGKYFHNGKLVADPPSFQALEEELQKFKNKLTKMEQKVSMLQDLSNKGFDWLSLNGATESNVKRAKRRIKKFLEEGK